MSNKIIVPGLCLCLLLSSFTFLISSCRHNPKKIDVSGIKLEARVLRLDRDFYELSGNNAKEQVKAMQKKYGDFFQLFVGHPNFLNYNYARLDSLGTLADSLLYYRHDPVVQMIFDTTENHYKNFKPIEEEMTNALRHYHYYYPSKPVPVFIPMLVPVLQGNHAFTYEDNIISANLFYYLGANCSFYQQGADPEPRFLVWKYTPAFSAPATIRSQSRATRRSSRPGGGESPKFSGNQSRFNPSQWAIQMRVQLRPAAANCGRVRS